MSSRLCWYAGQPHVAVDVGQQLVAHVSGVKRCGSSWACPVCAPIIRERRALEVDVGLRTHLERGGGAEFLTLTVRHHQGDRLGARLDVVAQCLNLLLKGSAWDRRRSRLGYCGAIKALEITWGERNGWHPHAHNALLFDRPLTDLERSDLLAWITDRWSEIATRNGFGTLNLEHGVDLRPITPGEGIGSYVTKIEGGWTAGHELTRSDRKTRSPLTLLRNLVTTGETRWANLWLEYEDATFGRRSLRWSPGLRKRLGLEDDQADEELAASEGIDLTLLRALIEAADWNKLARAGATPALLEDIERGAALLLGISHLLGHVPQPLDAPTGDVEAPAGSSPPEASARSSHRRSSSSRGYSRLSPVEAPPPPSAPGSPPAVTAGGYCVDT